MHYPKPLTKGSTIAITAFSSGLSNAHLPRFQLVCEHLTLHGFNLEVGQCLMGKYQGASASADDRARELMGFLTNDSVDAIYPPWGGELAMEVLPLLDFDALALAKPKWIMGFSDVSTVAVALTSKLGWASAHTPNLMDLIPNAKDTLTEHTLSHMATASKGQFTQFASPKFAPQWPDFCQDSAAQLDLCATTRWQWLVAPQQGTSVTGRIIGGCWDTLIDLFSTEFLDLSQLNQRYPEGIILYLENAEMNPEAIARAILSMKFRGVFKHIKGLVLGRSFGPESAMLSYRQVLSNHLVNIGIPVAIDLDIGHAPPNLTIINGSVAHLDMGKQPCLTQHLV
ncbi:hypothetical protein ST37_17840 [Vibrio sp. qd031]|uniref:S66 family peptidase n=1 Tax=Vibrio sp. qd031 TaxID=1603038 RepID=UPI000A0FBC6B|nr:S66 peptidase family protein [Vibrio sp. qd031]ORT48611.1 hypothetical protein ST37_17840 [Vibrio sp. qd031]